MKPFVHIVPMSQGDVMSLFDGDMTLVYVKVVKSTFNVLHPQQGRLVGRFELRDNKNNVKKSFLMGELGMAAQDIMLKSACFEQVYHDMWFSINYQGYRFDNQKIKIVVKAELREISP